MTEQSGIPPFFETYPHPALLLRGGVVRSCNPAAAALRALPSPGEAAPVFLQGLELADGWAALSCTLAGLTWEADAVERDGGVFVVFHPSPIPAPDDSQVRLPFLLDQMRQHVNNLSAATQLISPELRETGGAKAEQCLAIMNHSYYRLMRLMNALEAARNLNGEDPAFQPAPLDLAGFCRELTDQIAPLADRAGVRFHYDCGLLSLLTVADASLLRGLFLSLVSNALRAAGRDGEAGMRLKRSGGQALVTVWDRGPGLAPGALDGPADPYRTGAGLGLGLPNARRIAALHGGAVMLESRPGKGVRATVSLPLRAPERSGSVRAPRAFDSAGGFSPVLVELSDLLPYQAFSPDDVE